MLQFSPEILQDFAKVFVDAQQMRILADYTMSAKFSREEVIDRIEVARNAIRNLKSCDIQAWRAFLAWVVLP